MAYINDPVYEDDVFESTVFTGVSTDKIQEIRYSDKIIYLKSGVTVYHPTDDIYPEVRFHRRYDESLRVLDIPVVAEGNIAKGGGKFTARLAIFNDGWRIAPADETHVLGVTGEQITDDGQAGTAVMDMTRLSDGITVSVEYTPPDTEIITINTGSAVTEQDKLDIAEQTRIELATEMANLDATVSSRSSHSAEDVWLVNSRTLTEDLGLTPDQVIKLQEIHEAHYNRRKHDSGNNTISIYESDNTTVKKVFDSNADLSDITPQ